VTLADEEVSYEHEVGLLITFEADQGDLTISEGEITADGGESIVRTWEFPIVKGNLLKMTATGWRVQNVAAQDQELVGIAHEKARPRKGSQESDAVGVYDDSPNPKVYREVQVEVYGLRTRNLEISSDGSTVAPVIGDSVKHDTAGGGAGTPQLHKWEGSGSLVQGQNMVLRTFAKDSVTFATCLLDYGGKHA
jgi:hypothetical protein